MIETLSRTERMPEGEELEGLLAQASDLIKAKAVRRRRARRRRRTVLWSSIGAGVIALSAVAAAGPLRTVLIPGDGGAQAHLAVHCYDTAVGANFTTWYLDENDKTEAARVDPVAVCAAEYQSTAVSEQLDQIAEQQRALGRRCVSFDSTDGGRWQLAGLQSAGRAFTAVGGPVPWHLPGYSRPASPQASAAPLSVASPGASAPPAAGCVTLPPVTWKLSTPPMTACTKDDVTISVYERSGGQSAEAVCSARGLVTVGK